MAAGVRCCWRPARRPAGHRGRRRSAAWSAARPRPCSALGLGLAGLPDGGRRHRAGCTAGVLKATHDAMPPHELPGPLPATGLRGQHRAAVRQAGANRRPWPRRWHSAGRRPVAGRLSSTAPRSPRSWRARAQRVSLRAEASASVMASAARDQWPSAIAVSSWPRCPGRVAYGRLPR